MHIVFQFSIREFWWWIFLSRLTIYFWKQFSWFTSFNYAISVMSCQQLFFRDLDGHPDCSRAALGPSVSTHGIANFNERFRWARRYFSFMFCFASAPVVRTWIIFFRLCRIFQYPATIRYSHAQCLFVRGSSFMFSDFGLITHYLLALNKRIYFLSLSFQNLLFELIEQFVNKNIIRNWIVSLVT